MKKIKLLYPIFIVLGMSICTVLMMSSCAPSSIFYYQVYDVEPIKDSTSLTNEFFYEDENCKITYDLWSNNGNIGFNLYNKTNSNIKVKLNETFFILNGVAHDYFKNRTFTRTKSASNMVSGSSSASYKPYNYPRTNVGSSSTAGVGSSLGYSVSVKEDSIVYVPSKTSKLFSEYSINNTLIRNCDLLLIPQKKQVISTYYEVEGSPIVFSNRITYEINGVSKLVENKFFVSEITNYSKSEFLESRYDEYCGKRNQSSTKYYKFYDISKFFLKYKKPSSYTKH